MEEHGFELREAEDWTRKEVASLNESSEKREWR